MMRAKHAVQAITVLLALGAGVYADSPWKPEKLSPSARRVVRERMRDHAKQMGSLLWEVVLLDYDRAAATAMTLAKGASPLDRQAPELEHHVYFFTLQDQLQTRCLLLADAARSHDGLALATAFNRVSETCVHCHVVYREPSAEGPPRQPAP